MDLVFLCMQEKVVFQLSIWFEEYINNLLLPSPIRLQLHKAYTDSSDDKKTSKIKLADDDDEENEEEENTVKHDSMGGHLEDRLAQFDARTDRMKKEWYMAFSEVRKGSFLPRTSTQEER